MFLIVAPVALMVLIDCLAVINGHMLNMYIVDFLTQMQKATGDRGHLSRSTYLGLCAQHLG